MAQQSLGELAWRAAPSLACYALVYALATRTQRGVRLCAATHDLVQRRCGCCLTAGRLTARACRCCAWLCGVGWTCGAVAVAMAYAWREARRTGLLAPT